jgi:circadian clock protein KaiC
MGVDRPADVPAPAATGVPGLDVILGGGLFPGSVVLVVGSPGAGKTTLGNQIAFHVARRGGSAIEATVLAEGHDALLPRLRRFDFFDPALAGERVHYLSLFDALAADGFDGVLAACRREVRARQASLLVIDGATLFERLTPSDVEYARFVETLGALCRMLGCTALLLTSGPSDRRNALGQYVDGVLEMELESVGARDVRTLRVVKLRGAEHLLGRHDMTIDHRGVTVFPRLEALAGADRADVAGPGRLSTGIAGLDRMIGDGLLPATSTMLLGSPGAGKTLLGLHFLAEGARHGEPGLIVTFHEKARMLAETAARVGLDLAGPIEHGLTRVIWRPPLELSPDEWAWQLLAAVDEHRPTRLLIDGLSDIQRMILRSERMSSFVPALANELRLRGVTTLMTVELDAFVGPDLTAPVPAASATMDNGIVLRHVELRSRVRRLITVLKARQSVVDPAIREFRIGPDGIEVGEVFDGGAALLTGAPEPMPGDAAWEPAT